ncbi:Predicted arabinose efflux permease, MFS family [Paenibacillus algorifonticola]|uniref:Predicted arabinose efflux permease, MFS family n=1 Tax=Paenibacillus algorifonticola TaxID=684063 RepID=A0A1I2BSM8_9BACL|nr:MFS transporter [Paenibacillus algorifonticola]SFE58908.1 Predicted arabinose efflux permease, MFS family [Paenibacillus algorifonticola]
MTANQPASAFSLLSNRFVQAILMSTLFLQIGIWVRNIAVLLYVKKMTNDDAFAVSLISVAEFAPIFVFSFIGGTFADRWRPKKTMVWCDILSALSILAVLFAMENGTWHAVFFATLISAILSQFSQPAGMKLFKLHVPEHLVQTGMSLYQTLFAVFMIFGPVVGTFIYQSYGIETAIGVMGAAFLLSAVSLAFLPRDRDDVGEQQNSRVVEDIKAGFRYVWSSKILRTLGGGFIAAGLGLGLIQPMGIFLITERLGKPEDYLQWFLLVNGIAMIIGGVLAMSFSSKLSPQKLLALGMTVDSLAMIAMGLSKDYWFTLGLQFISGFALPCIQIGINTLILQNTKESFIGRVNGILTPMFMGSMVVTMMLSGLMKNAITLVPMYIIAGLFFLLGVAILLPLFKLQSGIEPVAEKALAE